jgi:hypothetical protein
MTRKTGFVDVAMDPANLFRMRERLPIGTDLNL